MAQTAAPSALIDSGSGTKKRFSGARALVNMPMGNCYRPNPNSPHLS